VKHLELAGNRHQKDINTYLDEIGSENLEYDEQLKGYKLTSTLDHRSLLDLPMSVPLSCLFPQANSLEMQPQLQSSPA